MARGQWWEIFGDSQLNSFEEQINLSNLKAAVAQFEQARALVTFYRANYYPTLSAGVSGARNRQSENRPLATSLSKTSYTDLVLPTSVSYEVDVFGRVRRTVEAARSNAGASAGSARNHPFSGD